MCRSIKRLNTSDHQVTHEEIEAAALQFVRKVSGMRQPSKIHEKTFHTAVDKVSNDIHTLLESLQINPMQRHAKVVSSK